jgi:iron complex transport system ATP-binding protein
LTVIFITQRIEDILPEFDYGLLLKSGKIFAAGSRQKILSETNLSEIFQINTRLIPGRNGRIWSIIEPNHQEFC